MFLPRTTSSDSICAVISALPEHQPESVRLLSGDLSAISRDAFIAATAQAVHEHQAMANLVERLNDLPPVAATTPFGDLI